MLASSLQPSANAHDADGKPIGLLINRAARVSPMRRALEILGGPRVHCAESEAHRSWGTSYRQHCLKSCAQQPAPALLLPPKLFSGFRNSIKVGYLIGKRKHLKDLQPGASGGDAAAVPVCWICCHRLPVSNQASLLLLLTQRSSSRCASICQV